MCNRILSVPVYERVLYSYPNPDEDFYVSIYDNRFIDWYDPRERDWGYRYSRSDLISGDIFLVIDINPSVIHAWAGPNRLDYVAVKFLKGDVSGWLYQPMDTKAFTEVVSENPYNLAAK